MPKSPRSRNVYPLVAQARAKVAGLTARRADPELIAAARAELAEANAAADVAKWPQLPSPARGRLAILVLSSGGDRDATT